MKDNIFPKINYNKKYTLASINEMLKQNIVVAERIAILPSLDYSKVVEWDSSLVAFIQIAFENGNELLNFTNMKVFLPEHKLDENYKHEYRLEMNHRIEALKKLQNRLIMIKDKLYKIPFEDTVLIYDTHYSGNNGRPSIYQEKYKEIYHQFIKGTSLSIINIFKDKYDSDISVSNINSQLNKDFDYGDFRKNLSQSLCISYDTFNKIFTVQQGYKNGVIVLNKNKFKIRKY